MGPSPHGLCLHPRRSLPRQSRHGFLPLSPGLHLFPLSDPCYHPIHEIGLGADIHALDMVVLYRKLYIFTGNRDNEISELYMSRCRPLQSAVSALQDDSTMASCPASHRHRTIGQSHLTGLPRGFDSMDLRRSVVMRTSSMIGTRLRRTLSSRK